MYSIQKRTQLIALILSLICLVGNLVMIVFDIIDKTPYWKHIINVFLMLAIAFYSYKSFKSLK